MCFYRFSGAQQYKTVLLQIIHRHKWTMEEDVACLKYVITQGNNNVHIATFWLDSTPHGSVRVELSDHTFTILYNINELLFLLDQVLPHVSLKGITYVPVKLKQLMEICSDEDVYIQSMRQDETKDSIDVRLGFRARPEKYVEIQLGNTMKTSKRNRDYEDDDDDDVECRSVRSAATPNNDSDLLREFTALRFDDNQIA